MASKNTIIALKGARMANGLTAIHLHFFQGKNYLGHLVVRSGLAGRQNFRRRIDQRVGQYEPCPEGVYKLGPLLWASGRKGDYKTLWPAVKSPIWVEIEPNRAIGFHFDGGTPGSAGCLVFPDDATMKKFVDLWNGYGGFHELITDWGLGSIQRPADLKIPPQK